MKKTALALLLVLAACGRGAPDPVAEAPSFRDRAQPIASTTRGTPGDLVGEWVVSQAFPGAPFRLGPGGRIMMNNGPDGGSWAVTPPNQVGWVMFPVRRTGPGRYTEAATGREYWVLWVDDDFRTAVIGTPDGTFGWIMDRPGEASPDRTQAAREMLDFNGYDVTRLAG